MNFWQVGTGDAGRDYSPFCLDHDVVCIGPGKFGPYDQKEYDTAIVRKHYKPAKISTIRSFYNDVEIGDIIILRNGQTVVGLGVVGSDYGHDNRFDDIFGWDLEHYRRVIWQHQLEEELKVIQRNDKLFGHLRQQTTFSAVSNKNGNVLDRIRPLVADIKERPLSEMPPSPSEPLELDDLGQQLFSKGIANDAVDCVLSAIERQRRLLTWYEDQGEASNRPKEHEVVAHLVLPLLLALGWSEQLLAIEWQKIDLAAFCETPTGPESCVLVCEAKAMKHGIQNVLEQAVGYVENKGLNRCRRILLTQGERFYLYSRPENGWSLETRPSGYINVQKIRTNNVYPSGTNAVDTIAALSPLGVLMASRHLD